MERRCVSVRPGIQCDAARTSIAVTTIFRYHAFISYSHADRKWAAWLHRAIETYRVPKRLVGDGSPARLSPLFRDRDELASSSDLGARIEQALAESAALIVICSPKAAASPWVNEEARRFAALGRVDRIFCLIVDGEPHAAQRGFDEAFECFPSEVLRHAAEPIAADVRPNGDGRQVAKLKIIAGLLRVGLDDLRRRDLQRRNRRLALLSGASLVGIVLTSALAAAAWLARNEAEANRIRAEREAETARRTTQFMVGLFNVVDPGEARGRSITAHEILERGVENIHRELRDEPTVQATLLETMGRVFTGLGLYRRSAELLEESLTAQPSNPSATVALGDVLYLNGDYDAAYRTYESAIVALGTTPWNADWSGAINGQADVLTKRREYERAIALYKRAFDNDVAEWGVNDTRAAHSLKGLAMAQLYSQDVKGARVSYQRALDAYRATLGPDHPKVAETINDLGAVAYFDRDLDAASAYYREALPLFRKVFGDVHPEVSTILNNLGRIELERNDIDAAQPLLEESVAIDRKLGKSEHDDFVFSLVSLALVQRARGNLDASMKLLDEAEALARRYEHQMWGPIDVARAEIDCAQGRIDAASRVLRQAKTKIRAARAEDELGQLAILDNVEGDCSSRRGERDEAERLLLDSLAAIEKHWGERSLFAADARRRVAAHFERTGELAMSARYRTD
jgi:tetratricopeptide (TPR) repeat protein